MMDYMEDVNKKNEEQKLFEEAKAKVEELTANMNYMKENYPN